MLSAILYILKFQRSAVINPVNDVECTSPPTSADRYT